jgi:hypothetical protein
MSSWVISLGVCLVSLLGIADGAIGCSPQRKEKE